MERKVIRIKGRTGNGLTRCDYCGNRCWDCMTYDVYRYDKNDDQGVELKPVCCSCLDDVRAYWLRRGYIVKESTING